jgi:hypothetical protein
VPASTGEAQIVAPDRLTFGAEIVRERLRGHLRVPIFDQISDRRHVPVAATLDPLEIERSP